MKTTFSLTALAAAFALTAALPIVQSVAPFAGSSAALARQGADDGPNHDANDDKGGRAGGHGADDSAAHDRNDDKGGRKGGHGADDAAGHHKNDDKGVKRVGHR